MPDPSIDEVSKSDWDALTTQEQDDIISQVENLSSTGWVNTSRERKAEAIRSAIAERDTLYSGNMSRLPTLDGDAEYFTLYLSAHKIQLFEGGEAQSESGEGGSVSYSTGGGGEKDLQKTRYGRMALEYVWEDNSIAALRTY
ncbi:HK97 gp6-like/SPP1 gp15-like head-tail connector [Haloferax tailed virus 1]|uniref:HK97 gp6-like/SPP1 gp15-like head-tail connector n=1 Tax=Haloferax tailed virus 1 TaxID=2507575 RepID=A0A410N6S3_HFTV1|nr:HK97 gp6-like/SPP1 gp15-like head-tail connector [Haloferax tailed virus 1]QAS68859.1 HK97 gp6-like/SPP1 gp15-like head-tail connector [Haloferax tailed virus 1]